MEIFVGIVIVTILVSIVRSCFIGKAGKRGDKGMHGLHHMGSHYSGATSRRMHSSSENNNQETYNSASNSDCYSSDYSDSGGGCGCD